MFLMFIPSNDSRIQIDIDLFDLLIFLNTLLNVTISTSLLSAIRFPVIPPGPRIRFTLPFGIPIFSKISNSFTQESTQLELGLNTTLFHAASAGASFHTPIRSG